MQTSYVCTTHADAYAFISKSDIFNSQHWALPIELVH